MSQVMACIDGSQSSRAVCDCAIWATQRLDSPLTLLHVLDAQRFPLSADLSGNIDLGSREHLLEALADLDAQRNRLAMTQGQHLLEDARNHALAAGVQQVDLRQRHGHLIDTLRDEEARTRLLVMGRQGESSDSLGSRIGSQLENVARTLHHPILVTPPDFTAPQRVMIAFDGSLTSRTAIERLAASALLKGLVLHVVTIGDEGMRAELDWAGNLLSLSGYDVHTVLLQGDVEDALLSYQAEQQMHLLVMGAYGHSSIRRFLLGSTTSNMIHHSHIPLLLLR